MAEQETALRTTARSQVHAAKGYVRFSLAQRIEHIVLLVSFSLLGITGLVQKYAGNAIAESLIQALGGIERVRTIHHWSAIIFVILSIYHFIVLVYKVFVLRTDLSMLPGLRDVTDAVGLIRYNVGLGKRRPKLPRYGFDEKVEYWAMIWGTVVMAITGFMLWNPILFTKFLPGQIIPAAKAAHGGEALLAVLAIIVWHFYNVHIKHWNTSMWTGRLSEHAMAEEHGGELEQIEAGETRPRPAPEVIRKRARVVLPIAIAMGLVMAGVIVWLTTAEQTAIATVPTPSAPVFVPLPPTLVPTAAAQIGKPVPHAIAGREQCLTCHAADGAVPFPADHAGRPNESCLVCHGTGGAAAAPADATSAVPAGGAAAAIPHVVQGREDCLMCHKEGGVKPVPADHAGRTNETCQACHQLAPAISGTPAAASTPSAAPAEGGAAAIPHATTLGVCDTCHGTGGIKPYPADHAGRSADTCTTCHKPAGEAPAGEGTATPASDAATTPAAAATEGTPGAAPSGGGAAAIPHATTLGVCDTCHGTSGIKPYPADHAGRSADTCTTCHKPAVEAAATPMGETAATPEATAGQGTPAAAGTATAAPAAGVAAAIPHAATLGVCDTCHGTSGIKPYPADHVGRSADMCTVCHKPAS